MDGFYFLRAISAYKAEAAKVRILFYQIERINIKYFWKIIKNTLR